MTTTTLDTQHPQTNQNTGAAPAVSASASPSPVSKRALWAGRVLSGLAVLFLGFDGVFKLFAPPAAVEGTVSLGYQASSLFTIGVIQIVCLIAYLVPSTSIFGAILWTGYLGGAIATHFRLGNPLFSHQLFPIYVAAFVWGGLWLREPRLRALIPIRRSP